MIEVESNPEDPLARKAGSLMMTPAQVATALTHHILGDETVDKSVIFLSKLEEGATASGVLGSTVSGMAGIDTVAHHLFSSYAKEDKTVAFNQARSQLQVTARYTGIHLRKNCAVPFRGGNQLQKFCSRNKRLPSQWVATKTDWQTATPPWTVVLDGDTRAKRIMDPFPILRAGAMVSSVAGAVGAFSSPFSPLSPYKPTGVSFSDVRARYVKHFENAMRMSEDAFIGLVGVLRSRLHRRGVSAEVRTVLALRYLGGGSYVDICAAFGVHSATVCRALWDVVDAVIFSPDLDLDFQMAEGSRRQEYGARFQAQRNYPFNNVIGALDGVVIEQEQPLPADVTRVADFYSRKGFYALNVQAICDADYKLRWMSCRSPGSAHDSINWVLMAVKSS